MARRKLSPEENKRRKRKVMIRRVIFGAICLAILALLMTLIVLLFRAIFGGKVTPKPAGFEQIGPAVAAADTGLAQYVNLYDFALPAPESEKVSDAYFTDVLFIGDSRTLGLSMYGNIGDAKALASSNVSVSGAWDYSFGENGETIAQALAEKPYSAIYIGFGTNELGWPYVDSFIEEYGALIDNIRAAQPLTSIYVQAIIPISANRSASGDSYNNERVALFNTQLQAMCAKKEVYFLDLNAAYADETGALPAEYTGDGINLNTDCFDIWHDYLVTHTVKKELYTN